MLLCRFAVASSLILWVFSTAAWAQFNSSIFGTVSDSSGAVVAGATVTITNSATGVVREAIASDEGLFRVLNLGPGTYVAVAEKVGFRTAERKNIPVGVSETVSINFALEVGAISERITVAAAVAQVETEQGRISGRIDTQQLKELPLNGRNLYSLIALQPGVTGRGLASTFGVSGGGSNNDSFAGENGPQINASGQRAESNNFSLDDTSVNSTARGGVSNLTPNADSVAEIRVVANNFSAVDGRNSGAQVQMVSKSGSNEFHGGASWYFQNNTLSTRNAFEAAVPVFRRNQFGYFIGGPVIKNRTFFFTSYEGLRQSGTRGSVYTVETPAFRNLVTSTRPNTIAAKVLSDFRPALDPTSNFRDLGSPAAGVNRIGPADGIVDVGSVVFAPNAYRNGQQFTGRIDHELRPGKDKLYGNFYRSWNDTLNGGIRPQFNRPGHEYASFLSLNEIHIFSPNKINEFRAGVIRLVGVTDVPPHLEIPQLNVSAITGFSTNGYPSGYGQTSFSYKDVYSWIHGSHTFKMGGELRRMWANSKNTSNFIPAYTFASILDFADDEPLQMVRKVDPRTGDPATNNVGLRGLESALFFNDDWKVSRNLTLNLGLRYENYGSPKEVNGILRDFVPGAGSNFTERLTNGRVDIVNQFFPNDNKNWAPRFGFAWNPDGKGKLAIRGGYGIAYDRLFMTPLLDFRDNPPLRADATLGSQFGTSFTYSLGDPSKPLLGYPIDASLRLGLDDRNGIRGIRVALRGVDVNLKTSYTHNWFFGLQRDLGRGMIVEVNYTGTAGHRLYSQVNINRFSGDLLATGRFRGYNPSFAAVNMIGSNSNSIFHGGTMQLRRAFSQGFTLSAAYGLGKVINDADDLTNLSAYVDAGNRRLERGPAGYDVRHKLSMTGVWELPFLQKQQGFAGRVLGGWQLAGFVILQSGEPFSVTSSDSYPRGDFNADGTTGDRPNAPSTNLSVNEWQRADYLKGIFKTTDFPLPVPGTIGNLGRNTFRGPGFAETDLAFSKRIPFGERISGQLRLDAFNAFNRVNLSKPVSDLVNVNFGRSTSALIPRLFQVGLKVQF
jgi:hypothetical protein